MEGLVPDILNPELENYDESRILNREFFYLYDDRRMFCQGILSIRTVNTDYKMKWKVWVEINPKEFIRSMENMSDHVMVDGTLHGALAFYDDTENLNVKVKFKTVGDIEIPDILVKKEDSIIYHDFVNGISMSKFETWQNKLSK